MSITIAIAGLLALIFIHELGHFVAAKAVGMRATRFYVGFPPRDREVPARRHRVRDRRDPARRLREDRRHDPAARRATSSRSRTTVEQAATRCRTTTREELARTHAALVAALGGGDPARLPGLVADASCALVEAAAPHLDPERLGWCRKELERMAEEVHPRAYWRQQTWRKITAIAAGPGANLLAAIVILTVYFMSGDAEVRTRSRHRDASTPAARAAARAQGRRRDRRRQRRAALGTTKRCAE